MSCKKNITPLVSIVIPTYNSEGYLRQAIQSIIDQSFSNWELLVIDNFSTDNTLKYLNSLTDERISFFQLHNNGVIAASRNLGIKKAKGKWIAFLDSDDMWTSDKLKTVVSNFKDNVDLIYHSLKVVSDSKLKKITSKLESKQLHPPILKSLLVEGNKIPNSSVVVRKKLLEQVNYLSQDTEMIGCEDYNTWLKISQITDNFLYVDKCLGAYTIHKNNLSSTDMSKPALAAVGDFLSSLTPKEKTALMARIQYTKGHAFLKTGRFREAKLSFWFSLLHSKDWSIKSRSIIMILITLKRSVLGEG